VGLFKGMKDLSNLTKQAKEMRRQQEEGGYKPGFGGQMQQMWTSTWRSMSAAASPTA
jgi:hypothetical protein